MIELFNIIFVTLSLLIIFTFPINNKFIMNKLVIKNLNIFDIYLLNLCLVSNLLLVLSFFSTKLFYVCIIINLLALINLSNINRNIFKEQLTLLFFFVFFIIIYSLNIYAKPYLEWDAAVNWIFKVQNFYNNLNFSNLKNVPGVIEYPHLGAYLWAFFWKMSFINQEYTGRIIYFFIYLLSIFSLLSFIKLNIVKKIFLSGFLIFVSYDSILFSGYQEPLLFSLCLIFVIILNKFQKENAKFYLCILILVSNLIIWTKNEGMFLIILLSIFLIFNNKINNSKKVIIFTSLIFLIIVKKMIFIYYFGNYFIGWKGYEFISFSEIFTFDSLEKLFWLLYQLIITFFKYPIYLITILIFLISYNKKYYLQYWIFFFGNILFALSIFYLTNDEKWYFHATVGLDRIIYQTSGVYLFLIVDYLKKYAE